MAEGFSRYDVYTVTGSIYCYRNTNVLRNRLGIRDNRQLRIVEADITAVRQNDLMETPISGRFTSNHLCRIHKYLFGDIYPFAGHFRKEDITKGTTRFLFHKEIPNKLAALLGKLKGERYLQNLPEEKLVSRSAYYLAELNYIHPFREGNGRSIREFMRLLYVQADYDIHWNAVAPEVLLQATEESVYRTAMLESVLAECLEKRG